MGADRIVSEVALIVLIVVLIWDAFLTAKLSNDTLSNVITSANAAAGGLIALALAVLWIHWFVPLPESWVPETFRKADA